jgi:release factor glutamine methyltransferase
MTRYQLLTKLRQLLFMANIADATNEARDLVLASLSLQRSDLITAPDVFVTPKQATQASNLIQRRLNGEPVDRILGYREFKDRIFHLNADTLSPREDSECVVDLTLEIIKDKQQKIHILDLGTGTGCLLLSLLTEMPNATGLGVDISKNAVEMATQNAKNLKLDARANFITSNWFEAVNTQFNLIISNPPYIKANILTELEREVRDYDPMLALNGGDDGLDCYRLIAQAAKQALKPHGSIVVEIGKGQGNDVIELFKIHGLNMIKTCKDGGDILRGIAFS